MRKRRADDIAASGAVSTSDSPPTKERLRLDSTAVHQMIQRLDSHEITGESIRQVLTEIIETDNPDAKQTDPADLVKPKRPHYIMPLYNLDDPVDDRRLSSCILYSSTNCTRAPKNASGCCSYYCNGGGSEGRRR